MGLLGFGVMLLSAVMLGNINSEVFELVLGTDGTEILLLYVVSVIV